MINCFRHIRFVRRILARTQRNNLLSRSAGHINLTDCFFSTMACAKGSGFATGLMGEAGPEAIMPLSRGTDGRLGVRVDGQGGAAVVAMSVVVNNYSQEKIDVREGTDETGQRQLQIMVGAMFNDHITSGRADKAMKSRYGIAAQGF